MKTVFIDADFRCHTRDDGLMTPVDVPFFRGKCDAFIEGYMYIPFGATYIKPDGEVLRGRMVTPWRPYSELSAAQEQYEQDLADRADLEAAYNYLLTGGTK